MKTYSPEPGRVYVVPENRVEIPRVFGVMNTFRCHSATIVLPHPVGDMTELQCNPAAKDAIELALKRIDEQGYWPMIRQIGRVYENRPRSSIFPVVASLRQYGAGVVLNHSSNRPGQEVPQERVVNGYVVPEEGQTVYDDTFFYPTHPIVLIFKELGFSWGGDRKPPTQYAAEFELVQGY